MIELALAMMLSGASESAQYIRRTYPPAIVPLLLQEADLDGVCRGGSTPTSMRACNRRQLALKRLQERGWCWGGADIEANKHFIRCKPGDRDYAPREFDHPYFTEAEIAEARADMTPYERADSDLNASYSRLMATYRPDGRSALRDAQRVWLAGRNRYCGAEAQNACALRLTQQRTVELDRQFSAAHAR